MKRVLVTGGTGLLGVEVLNALLGKGSYEIFAITRQISPRWAAAFSHRVGILKGDLIEPASLTAALAASKPAVIIHCAAWVDLDGCEQEPAKAERIHIEATSGLAGSGARMIYVSTDSVFDDSKLDYGEQDQPAPLNQYALTKLAGENVVLATAPQSVVVRTNLYGWHTVDFVKPSIIEWAYRALREGGTINGFSDCWFNPLYSRQLARALVGLVDREDIQGLLHLGSDEPITKFEFLVRFARKMGLDSENILPGKMGDFKKAARRPARTVLRMDRWISLMGKVPSLEAGLDECVQDFKLAKDAVCLKN